VVPAPISTSSPIHVAQLGGQFVAALHLVVPETVRADHRVGVQDRTGADDRVLVQDHVGEQHHPLAQLAACHDPDTGVDPRSAADLHVVADHGVGMDHHVLGQLRRRTDHGRWDECLFLFGNRRPEEHDDPGECRLDVLDANERNPLRSDAARHQDGRSGGLGQLADQLCWSKNVISPGRASRNVSAPVTMIRPSPQSSPSSNLASSPNEIAFIGNPFLRSWAIRRSDILGANQITGNPYPNIVANLPP
jgi:hypothetical protein